jgi:Transposase IS4
MSFSLHAEADAPQHRRSARERQEPVRLQAEQEGEALSRDEAADVAAALLLSMQPEAEEAEDDVDLEAAPSDDEQSEAEEEEKKVVPPAADGWNIPAALRQPPLMARRINTGVPMRLPARVSRLSLLQLFLTPELMTSWAQLTNVAADAAWQPTDSYELLAFIGVHVFMGIDSLPERRMYWQSYTRHQTVAAVLSRDRFESITRYLRVSPPEEGAAPRNPFTFVRAFIVSLNRSFPRHWKPGRHIALDESMVSFRGRSDIKQFVPGKPHPHGYKIWVLANENYVLQFQLYQGKAAAGPSIHDMVLQLTQLYCNNNHVLYIDTLFTSPTLLASLFIVGIRVCGSVKRNRIGMPSAGQLTPAQLLAVPRGAHMQMQRGDATLCAWRDKRLILLLYNHIDPNQLTSMQRWGEDGVIYQLVCPQAIRDYFHHARAVDVINQLHYSYLPGRKSKKCYTRLVWWLIDICILNAYRLWRVQHADESHLDFRIQLACELIDCLPPDRRPQQGAQPVPGGASLAKDHYSLFTRERGDCKHCSRQPDHRVTTHYICAKCHTRLCVGACFAAYHA